MGYFRIDDKTIFKCNMKEILAHKKLEFPLMLNKSQASKYMLGYIDVGYINTLLKEEKIGIRVLPYKNTTRVIYRKDLDKFIDDLPLLKG